MFVAVKITKSSDIDNYKFSVFDIGFDKRWTFSFSSCIFGCNVINSGVDMSSSVHVGNKKKDILILGEGLAQGLDGTTLTAEKKFLTNFTVTRKKFCFSLHYKGANSYLFVNGTEIINFKAKDSEVITVLLCLGNISEDFSVDNVKINGINGYIYDFSVDYDAFAVDNILEIHKYLKKNNGVV